MMWNNFIPTKYEEWTFLIKQFLAGLLVNQSTSTWLSCSGLVSLFSANGCILPNQILGAESPGAVRKLMSLSDKVRPHNPKVPVGKLVSPTPNRRSGAPVSPRIGPSRPVPVNLTPESSCLGPRKQPMRTGKEG